MGIERLLVPRLRAIGSGPRDASADEVCRRMAIDLLGRVLAKNVVDAETGELIARANDEITEEVLAKLSRGGLINKVRLNTVQAGDTVWIGPDYELEWRE